MLLTAKLKLPPNEEQCDALLETMERCNQACNKVSAIAFYSCNWNRIKLQKQCYYEVHQEFGLSVQTAILMTRKVADTYKIDSTLLRKRNARKRPAEPRKELRQHKFKKHGAVAYDARCLSFKRGNIASILTFDGRVEVPLVLSGKYADLDLSKASGEADLLYLKGKFYLAVGYEAVESEQLKGTDFIGVDLGRKNIAATSDGAMFCGDACEHTRQRYKRLTALYQSVGTKSAMRHVRKLAGREASFKKDVNHNISKQLVSSAKGTGRGLALEELTHIPRPAPATKDQNDAGCKWAFRQLRHLIAYKARLAGVPLTIVDPAYTSQKCSVCGHVDEDIRRSQASFVCLRCGHAENADVNASRNIRDLARAAVDRPMVVRRAEVSA